MNPDDALLVDAVVRICRELPKRGLQRRVLMAALSEAYSSIQVQHLLGCGKNQFTSSVKDASFLLAGFELQKGEQSLQRYDKDMVQRCVEFILKNTRLETWGTTEHTMTATGKTITTPRLTRLFSKTWMWVN